MTEVFVPNQEMCALCTQGMKRYDDLLGNGDAKDPSKFVVAIATPSASEFLLENCEGIPGVNNCRRAVNRAKQLH